MPLQNVDRLNALSPEERVDPDHDDLYGAVAEALAKHSRGESFEDVTPASGRPPAPSKAEQKESEVEQRKENNAALGDFE